MKKIDKHLITKIQSIGLAVAMLMLLVAAVFPLLGIMKEEMMLMRYVYAAGAALAFVVRASEVYEGKNFRVKRLHGLERMSALLYCVSSYLLFNYGNEWGGTDWIAFLLAGGIVQTYASYMIDREEKKDASAKPE